MSSSENESSPLKGKRKNPLTFSDSKPSRRRTNVNYNTSFDNEEEKEIFYNDDSEDEEQFVKTTRKEPIKKGYSNASSKKNIKKVNNDNDYSDGELQLSDNDSDDDDDDKIKPMEAGQISKVYCENFMCHKKMSVAFGKHVTFVTGQNGSGKSAIAAAIQLCLGAATKSTGRGSSMGNLIREGSAQGYAIVSVTLINVGTDAFKPDVYGPKIRIERKIPKAGSAGYKLFSCDKNGKYNKLKCVSQDKKELMAMLAHFNIYVDNPTVILSQEESKKFIQGQEKEKYAFFLKATGLERISKELLDSKDQLSAVTESLTKQQDRLREKNIEKKKFKAELQQLIELDTFDVKIAECVSKKYWLHVMKYSSEVDTVKRSYDERSNNVVLATENLEKAEENNLNSENTNDLVEKSKLLQEEKNKCECEIEDKLLEINNARKKVSVISNEVSKLKKAKSEYSSRLATSTENVSIFIL
jgi:chromosome segregation ATPase